MVERHYLKVKPFIIPIIRNNTKMTFTSSKKVVAAVVGFGLALSIFAAVGVSTASAQAMTLSQLVDLFISLGIISSDKAAAAKAAVTSSASAMMYSKDLTVGSSGSEVSALQAKLGVSPASGYFGSITKAAVMAYQAANGVPSTGFVGPLTRAKLNGSAAVMTTPSTPGSTTVVNSGIEGTLTVTEESVSNSSVREGDTMKPLLGISVEAKLSDISLQRIKLDLGTTTAFYTKVYKTLYVVDASGKVLAQADLNSNTVTKNGANYELTFGGLNYVVQKDQEKVLTIKADLYASIKDADKGNKTLQLTASGVRGVDGAGIDQYGPTSAFGETISVTTSLVDSATLKLSTNSSNVKAADLVAADGSNEDELLDSSAPTVLLFDLRAEKDNVLVTDIAATVAKTGTGAATATKAYLYDGSNLIETGTINSTTGAVTFDDIDYTVQKDSTKTLSIKLDIRTANATASSFVVTLGTVTAENSLGSSVTATGSSVSETFVVRNIGAAFALVGTPSMTRTSVSSNDTSGIATSTGSANFTVSITAKGSDITFGSTASTSTMFGINGDATTTTTWLAVYKNGASNGALSANSAGGTNAIVSYSVPSSGVTTSGQDFTLAENNSIQIPVTVQFTVAGGSANTYAVQINGFRWYTAANGQINSTSMTNKSEWRSSAVSLP